MSKVEIKFNQDVEEYKAWTEENQQTYFLPLDIARQYLATKQASRVKRQCGCNKGS